MRLPPSVVRLFAEVTGCEDIGFVDKSRTAFQPTAVYLQARRPCHSTQDAGVDPVSSITIINMYNTSSVGAASLLAHKRCPICSSSPCEFELEAYFDLGRHCSEATG
jgi:hypothetical protein